tara:strand:+ start:279 stop:851 length:573 start_codon:yes stop_codon:yes gene_type:complete
MADQDMNPAGEMRDPRQMIQDMKTKARASKNLLDQNMTPEDEQRLLSLMDRQPMPTRGAAPGEPGSTEFAEVPRLDPSKIGLPSGVYSGAGGYEYEVMDNGAVKILKAPKDRGLGVVLTRGLAYDAIMDELQGSTPMSLESDRRGREMVGGVKPDDQTLAGAEMAAQMARQEAEKSGQEMAMAQTKSDRK